MKLLSAAALAALVVLLLPVAIPLGGILALCGGFSRDKPKLRPRRRTVREGVAFFGDTVALGTAHDRVMIVRRVRRGERWYTMISTN